MIFGLSRHPATRYAHVIRDFGSFIWPVSQPVRFLCGRRSFLGRCSVFSEDAPPDAPLCPRCRALLPGWSCVRRRGLTTLAFGAAGFPLPVSGSRQGECAE